MNVRDAMHPVMTVHAADELALAVQLMLWAGARHLPVVDDGRLVGVLSERDVLRHRTRRRGPDAMSVPVSEVMSSPPQWTSPSASLAEAAEHLAARKVGCLPVVDRGTVVGILTSTDVLAHQARESFDTPRLEGLRVSRAMTPDPIAVGSGDSLLEAANRMATLGARHLPVVDIDGKVVGILSDRDIRTAMSSPSLDPEDSDWLQVRTARVWSAMTADPVTVTADARLASVLPWFLDARVGAIPVVDGAGRLVGILSVLDVLRTLAGSVTSGNPTG